MFGDHHHQSQLLSVSIVPCSVVAFPRGFFNSHNATVEYDSMSSDGFSSVKNCHSNFLSIEYGVVVVEVELLAWWLGGQAAPRPHMAFATFNLSVLLFPWGI